jgi:hypothetical protein
MTKGGGEGGGIWRRAPLKGGWAKAMLCQGHVHIVHVQFETFPNHLIEVTLNAFANLFVPYCFPSSSY